jgi:polysaccharide biosynthesis transport protein
MRLGRARLPVLAEVSGPAPEGSRVWSLRRRDHERLTEMLPRLGESRVVLLTGDADATRVAAVSVASAAASSGRRTVLLECDLERPRLAADLGLRAEPGLHEYLRWEVRPEEVLQPLLLAGPAAGAGDPLACICAGRRAQSAEVLLGLGSCQHAVAKMRRAYELVLLAAPAPVPDPSATLAAARQADAVLAGMPAAEASGREGRPLRAAIRRLPLPALGTVAVSEA